MVTLFALIAMIIVMVSGQVVGQKPLIGKNTFQRLANEQYVGKPILLLTLYQSIINNINHIDIMSEKFVSREDSVEASTASVRLAMKSRYRSVYAKIRAAPVLKNRIKWSKIDLRAVLRPSGVNF